MHELKPSALPRMSPIYKWGPLETILVVLIGLVSYVGVTATTAQPTVASAPSGPSTSLALPPGVDFFSAAKQRGDEASIDWGPRCDTTTGKLKMPLWPLQDCFKPFTGDNGGSTAQGVTADTIKVVVYSEQDNDPVLRFVYQQIGNNDTPSGSFATRQGLVEIFNKYYELYGRKVELIRYVASGNIQDAVTARADAETIAGDLKPFAVIGGPQLTSAFADTLAANKIICIDCAPPQYPEWYEERSPYVWSVMPDAYQSFEHLAEFIGKKLAGRPARFAGDEQFRNSERVFGSVAVKLSEGNAELGERFRDLLSSYGVTVKKSVEYGSPVELPGTAKDLIIQLKEAGVTTVIFSGDPLGPQALTQVATEQGYFPEWVLGVNTLVDTNVFSRTYDQEQWAHAFGPSVLFPRGDPSVSGPAFLYRWYFDQPAPAERTAALLAGALQVMYGALQGVGPGLTPELFKAVLFNAPVDDATSVSAARVSFGVDRAYPHADYAALDDKVAVWWDPNAEGTDDLGKQGKGMWQYASGGKRFLLGSWSDGDDELFRADTSISTLSQVPDAERIPVFPPLKS